MGRAHLPETMPEEASDFAAATVKRFKLDKLTNEKKSLKELLEKRDNEEVLQHLKATGDKREENYRYAVLQLTCNNDHDTLKAVLDYGEKNLDLFGKQNPPKKKQ